MTNPNFADEPESPLDPALEKVRRKMVRLLIVSSSVIILGLMAVVFSIVYRSSNRAPASPVAESAAPAARQTISLPGGFKVESTSISGNRILLYGVGADGGRQMIVHDIGTGETITQIDLR